MARKPRVLTKCVANAYTGPDERIVEFSNGSGLGGLIALRNMADGTLYVRLYRLETGVRVVVDEPPGTPAVVNPVRT